MSTHTPAFSVFITSSRRQNTALDILFKEVVSRINALANRVAGGSRPRNRTIKKYASALRVGNESRTVLLVATTEAYLRDALAYLAASDAGVMSKSDQSATYAQVISITSIEDLAAEMRQKWARNFVDDGGPSRWIDRFQRMGASGYPTDLSAHLELLWGYRHAIIHNGGRATPEFCRRHPDVNAKIGDTLPLTPVDIERWGDAVRKFVTVTDKYLAARCNAARSA